MTEVEWLAATDPLLMVEHLVWHYHFSKMKLRRVMFAELRRNWDLLPSPLCREVVGVAERYWDGLAGQEEIRGVAEQVRAEMAGVDGERGRWYRACLAPLSGRRWDLVEPLLPPVEPIARACELFREVYGHPFGPRPAIDAAWLAWNGGLLKKLAEAAYAERSLPQGLLDSARLAVVGDALEESGCTDAGLLGHLRGPGPHVRGCFVLDALLGKL
jgi:hypothetical protein